MSNHPNRTWRSRARAACDRFLSDPASKLLQKGYVEGLREAFLKGYEEGGRDALQKTEPRKDGDEG